MGSQIGREDDESARLAAKIGVVGTNLGQHNKLRLGPSFQNGTVVAELQRRARTTRYEAKQLRKRCRNDTANKD